MATAIRKKDGKGKKISQKILGKPLSANKPSADVMKLNQRMKALYTAYQR